MAHDQIERALQLEAVPEPAKPNPTGKNQHSNGKEVPRHDGGKPHAADRTAERLRAIASRAPEEARQAYTEGRLSQTVAAKLGPANAAEKSWNEITRLQTFCRGDVKTCWRLMQSALHSGIDGS